MNELGVDMTALLTTKELKLLEQLRELELEVQKGLLRLAEPDITAAEKAETKEKLLSITNFKIELTKRMEELAQEEIREQNKKIRSLNQLLVDGDATLGLRSNSGKSLGKRKTANFPVAFDEESNVFCICRKNVGGEMVECGNEYCKHMWFHKSCVGLREGGAREWFCEECLMRKDCVPRKKATARP